MIFKQPTFAESVVKYCKTQIAFWNTLADADDSTVDLQRCLIQNLEKAVDTHIYNCFIILNDFEGIRTIQDTICQLRAISDGHDYITLIREKRKKPYEPDYQI